MNSASYIYIHYFHYFTGEFRNKRFVPSNANCKIDRLQVRIKLLLPSLPIFTVLKAEFCEIHVDIGCLTKPCVFTTLQR